MTHPDRAAVLTHQRDAARSDLDRCRRQCHDLRNRLTPLYGALQMVRDDYGDALSERDRAYINGLIAQMPRGRGD